AIASSGPTSAADRSGERSQRTTSISAADAISAKTMTVQRRLERISSKNGRREVTATTSEMRTRLIPYWVEADRPTLAIKSSVPSPMMKLTRKPPTAAATANTDPLEG